MFNMDLQIPLIFVGVFLVASVILVLIYKFGIKEKSYEEALAEQRQQTNALLGTKPKPKEKKNKKAAKKAKEKQPTPETEITDDPEASDPIQEEGSPNQKKHHVEFKEEPEEVPVVDGAVPPLPKKRVKKDKVRPILVGKDKAGEILVNRDVDTEVPPANHFEELHPKDEFELLRSNSNDELVKQESSKQSKTKPQGEPEPSKGHNRKQSSQPETVAPLEKKEERSESHNAPPNNGLATNAGKEKKKKKSEYNTLQQMAGDGNGPNMPMLLNLVRKAELSRSEVQILIDLLLNKQHEAPAIVDEWSEGKSDPVQKLKKQLAEKEKLLADEQEALTGAQNKLREVRAEQLAEKSQLQQKIRGYEEVLHNKQVDHTRLHQQLQQLQTQLQDELMKSHKLREEIAAIQIQRQQIEIRIAQAQEAEVAIAQLQGENQELSNVNQQMRMELTRLSEENMAEKDREQGYLVQLGNFQQELEQKGEYTRKLEESRRDTEVKLEKALRQENEFKIEISRLNSAYQQEVEEVRRLEHSQKQYQEEVYHLQQQNEELDKTLNEYKHDLDKLEEEKSRLQVTQTNGSVEESKAHKVEILNLHNELASIKTQLQQTERRYEAELQAKITAVDKLQTELREQKEKNDKLRTRNWKVMEALSAAENRIKSSNPRVDSDQSKSEQEHQIKFVQRLFPEIKELQSISPETFQTESEKLIRKFIENLREQESKGNSEEIRKLESQIQNYKNAIDSTDKMLSDVQQNIEKEEINWRVLLATKTDELEAIKASNAPQLKTKVSSLEEQLREEKEEKNRIIEEFEQFRSRAQDADAVATIERLSEEVNRLREQLQQSELNKNGDVDASPKVQNCNSTNGPTLIQESNN